MGGSLNIVVFLNFCLLISAFLNPSFAENKTDSPNINCDIQKGACSQNLSKLNVTFDITPKPVKAMQDLTFHIKLTGEMPEKSPYIDLGMPGMKMGPNQVRLKLAGKNAYEGRGVIVRCPSGRTIWRASITIPEKGVADFIFNVIY